MSKAAQDLDEDGKAQLVWRDVVKCAKDELYAIEAVTDMELTACTALLSYKYPSSNITDDSMRLLQPLPYN